MWWVAAALAVPAMVFLPVFVTSIVSSTGFHPTVAAAYFFAMLGAIPCGPIALVGYLVALAWRGVSWQSTLFVSIAVVGSWLAFGRLGLRF